MAAPGLFQRQRTIEEKHIDELGHVNNLVWVRFVLELADAHSSALGFTWESYKKSGSIWVVRKQAIDYILAAFPGDTVLEETWVSEMRGARSIRNSRFSREGKVLLEARTEWAFVDLTTQRPKRITPEMLAAFDLLPGGR